MSPATKKVIYGIGYLLIIAFIFYLSVRPSFEVPPSCFDNIKNQGEEDVDCGGPCEIACYAKYATPLEITGQPLLFKDVETGKLFTFFFIQNKNSNVGSHRFYFTLKFFDKDGNFVGETKESSAILPLESRNFLVEYNDSVYNIDRIAKAEITIDEVIWSKSVEFSSPDIVLNEKPYLTKEGRNLVIIGRLYNNSIFDLSKVKIIALVLNKYGDPIFAGQTLRENFKSYESNDFKIFVPAKFFENVDLKTLKVDFFFSLEE